MIEQQKDLWTGVVDAPALPPTDQEIIFAWGQAHGFPEFLFDIRDYGGIIPKGEERWKEIFIGYSHSNSGITYQTWIEWCLKAIQKQEQ